MDFLKLALVLLLGIFFFPTSCLADFMPLQPNLELPPIDPLDIDGDGLPDANEGPFGTGTNPFDADTDGDGLLDGDEVCRPGINDCPTDPLDPDTDDDGLNDGVEIDLGIDPRSPNDVDVETDPDTGEITITIDHGLFVITTEADGTVIDIEEGTPAPVPLPNPPSDDDLDSDF